MSNRQISPNYQFLGNPGPKNNPGESSQQNPDCVATTNDCVFNNLRGIKGKRKEEVFDEKRCKRYHSVAMYRPYLDTDSENCRKLSMKGPFKALA